MNDNEPIIDREWNAIASRAKTYVPDDSDINSELLETYQLDSESPIGCSITNGTDALRQWRAKMYLGGKQRVLGYGSCYQCARLYDAVKYRFRQYSSERDFPGKVYNFGEAQASDDNAQADIEAIVCDMERLLLSRRLLKTAEQRASDQKSRKSAYQAERYTAKGRIEKLIEGVYEKIELMAGEFEKLNRRLDEMAKQQIAPVNPGIPPFLQPNPAWKDAPYPANPDYAPIITCENNQPVPGTPPNPAWKEAPYQVTIHQFGDPLNPPTIITCENKQPVQ